MARYASPELQAVFGADAGIYHLSYLEGLRSGEGYSLDLGDLPGLVVIPSFHTVCGLLIAYSCRGIRLLWLVGLLYAVVMIASTPIMGGHYFVDLIAGAFLTLAIVSVDNRAARTVKLRGEMVPAAGSTHS